MSYLAWICGLSNASLQDKLVLEKDINWNNEPTEFKRGRCVVRDEILGDWFVDNEIPVFTQERTYLRTLIPRYE